MILPSQAFWAGRRVLVTGHTGFKGTWLCHWLVTMGAEVSGFALDPVGTPNLWDGALVPVRHDIRGDLRDFARVREAMAAARPSVVFHLGAQALVREGYRDPLGTFATNVLGTAHVLEACAHTPGVEAVVAVTTDKVYEDVDRPEGFVESDPLGGHDPYAASKAASEIATQCWQRSYFANSGIRAATARAGNVLGGGDNSPERLVPDLIRSFRASRPVVLRRPDAIRPWQHVLEPLTGYLLLAERLTAGSAPHSSYNFGPDPSDFWPVIRIVETLSTLWGGAPTWLTEAEPPFHETTRLVLNSARAHRDLQWTPRLDVVRTLRSVATFARAEDAGVPVGTLLADQLRAYLEGTLGEA